MSRFKEALNVIQRSRYYMVLNLDDMSKSYMNSENGVNTFEDAKSRVEKYTFPYALYVENTGIRWIDDNGKTKEFSKRWDYTGVTNTKNIDIPRNYE